MCNNNNLSAFSLTAEDVEVEVAPRMAESADEELACASFGSDAVKGHFRAGAIGENHVLGG